MCLKSSLFGYNLSQAKDGEKLRIIRPEKIMRRAITYVMMACLLVVAVCALSGCAGGAATSKFTLTGGADQLPAKPDNCLIEVVQQNATTNKAYTVIGDIFVGGGDA